MPVLRPLALLAALVLSGCAATAPASLYDEIPSRPPPPSDIAEAQPAAPTGDPLLDATLAEIAAAVDRHDWRTVADFMEAEPFAEQLALVREGSVSDEAAAAQVMAETLGISSVWDYDAPERGFDALDRIRVITLRQVAAFNNVQGGRAMMEVTGDVRTRDGATHPLRFMVAREADDYVIVVPMG